MIGPTGLAVGAGEGGGRPAVYWLDVKLVTGAAGTLDFDFHGNTQVGKVTTFERA